MIRKLTTAVAKKRLWISLSDAEILGYGKEQGYNGLTPGQLQEKDSSYYATLKQRELLDSVVKRTRRAPRSWNKMTDDEVFRYGIESGYKGLTPSEVEKKDTAYITVLRERGLVEKILNVTIRNFESMSDEEFLRYAINRDYDKLTRGELQKKDNSVYRILVKRDLLEDFIKSKRRHWREMTDEELLEYGKKNGYSGLSINRLKEKDSGFLDALLKRNLGDKLLKPYEVRDWKSLSDKELVEYGRKHGYKGLSPVELEKKDASYLHNLYLRRLAEKIVKPTLRNFRKMTDEEILKYGRKMGYEGIAIIDLQKKDSSYYEALKRRALTEKLLTRIRRSWSKMTDEELIKFAVEHGYKGLSLKEVEDKDPSYVSVLRKRGLLDSLIKSSKRESRFWSKMTDDEFLEYGRKHGYSGLSHVELENVDQGYHSVLYQRKLVSKLLKSELQFWSNMTDEEIIDYGKIHGYDRLSPKELSDKDSGYLRVLRLRSLAEKIVKSTFRNFRKMNDEEVLAYGKEKGYEGLTFRELQRTDASYDQVLRRRGLTDKLLKRTIRASRHWSKKTDEEILAYGREHKYDELSQKELEKVDKGFGAILRTRNLVDKFLVRDFINKKSFVSMLRHDELTKLVIEKLGGSTGDIADILTVIYNGLSRERTITYLQDSTITPYLGNFEKGIKTINDLQDLAINILPFDNKEGALKELLTRKFMDYRRRKLGNKPSREQREEFLDELQGTLFGE